MTLRHMKIFVAVCSECSITKAAQALHIAQPAVSIAVKDLEEYYGVKLFDRISRRIHLTDMGKRFLAYATHIVSLFGDLENNLRQWEFSAKLRVGASITVGTCLMPLYVQAFYERHPTANVEVFVGSSDMIENKILQNELDIALIEGIVHSDSILFDTYKKDRLSVVCSPNDPIYSTSSITIEQLLSRPLLLREIGSGTRELFDHVLTSLEYAYVPAWESTSTQALMNAARKGLGIAVIPYMLAQEKLKTGELVEVQVDGLRFERGFHMIYHKNKFLTGLAKEFMEICCNDA